MHLKIASRSSDLARWQAVKVGETLTQKFPEISVEYIFRSSFGDQNLDLPLAQMESKGVFTKDFYLDLLKGEFDLVVHSWKDLPTEAREETEIAATLERADVRDILLIPHEVWARTKQEGALKVLTSSPRRIYNLTPWLPDLLPAYQGEIEFIPVRGNIPSRLDKMFSQNAGLVMAKAAFDRMLSGGGEFENVKKSTREKISQCHCMVLPLEVNPTAAAQGALAIEISSAREDLRKLLKTISDSDTYQNVEMEREILKSYGGGCHQKIGVSRLTKDFGVYHVEKGESDWGTKLERHELLKNLPPMSLKEESAQAVFPLHPQENSWFERTPVSQDLVDLSHQAVIVARLGGDLSPLKSAAQIWAPGLRTWKKLAAKGFWVNGCFEGLGEQERKWAGPMAEGLEWIKLSHDSAPGRGDIKLIPFYHLKEKTREDSPDLSDKKFFYWMSSSSFKRALELYPTEIQAGLHACGPGNTYENLKNHSALKQPPVVLLNLKEFHEYLKKSGLKGFTEK